MLCEVSGVTPAWSSVPCLGNGAVIHGLRELSQWSEPGESGTGESCLQRLHLLFLAVPHPNPWQPRKCGLSSGYLSTLPTGAAFMLQAPSSAVGSHQLYDCIDCLPQLDLQNISAWPLQCRTACSSMGVIRVPRGNGGSLGGVFWSMEKPVGRDSRE